jgi:hypothetical protein
VGQQLGKDQVPGQKEDQVQSDQTDVEKLSSKFQTDSGIVVEASCLMRQTEAELKSPCSHKIGSGMASGGDCLMKQTEAELMSPGSQTGVFGWVVKHL